MVFYMSILNFCAPNYLVRRDMPTFFAVLDGCGEVVDFLKLNHFMKRKNSYWESEKLDKVLVYSNYFIINVNYKVNNPQLTECFTHKSLYYSSRKVYSLGNLCICELCG